ncbi:MAG: hypothetical protein QOG74_463, partial [Alphaproteobacteria bacterium]|nr:hypothetical protein [Alphaproteobacteria bacterium]
MTAPVKFAAPAPEPGVADPRGQYAPVKFATPASEPGAADPRGQYEQITRNALRVAWAQRRLLASA